MRRSSLLVAVLAVTATACQGWHTVATPAGGGSLEGNPELVRVTSTMGCGPHPTRSCIAATGTVTLYNPRITGDSLIGYYDSAQRERAAIAVSDITKVEARKIDKTRTAGAAIGSGLLITVALVFAALLALFGSMQ